MKTYPFCFVLLCLPTLAGEFINLGFDDPDLSGPLVNEFPGGPLVGDAAALLRGWTLTADGEPVTRMTYSPTPPAIGGSSADTAEYHPGQGIPGSSANFPLPIGGFPGRLIEYRPGQGNDHSGANYLLLQTAIPETSSGLELRLSQTGTIPADAAGLWVASAGYVQGFLNGTKIGEANPLLGSQFVWDLRQYAGQTVDLEFLVARGDSIRFDIYGFVSVPEPSTWALLGVGLGAVWCFGRNRRAQ